MAIKVQGTTVIDDSRNLQNVPNVNLTGNVYANTFIGDSSNLVNLPASGGSITATASGTLANGDKVIVNSDGTVSVVSGQDQSLGTIYEYQSSGDVDSARAIYVPNLDRVVVAYRDHEQSYIVTGQIRSSGQVTFGTPYQWWNGSYRKEAWHLMVDESGNAPSGEETIIMVFSTNTGLDLLNVVLFNVNSSGVTNFGSQYTVDSTASGLQYAYEEVAAVYSTSTNKAYVFWCDGGGYNQLKYRSITCGSTNNITPTFGTVYNVTSDSASSITATIDNTNHKILIANYEGSGSPSYAVSRVAIPNGDSLTIGSVIDISSYFSSAAPGVASSSLQQKMSVFDSVNSRVVLFVGASLGSSVYAIYGLVGDMGTGSSTSITWNPAQRITYSLQGNMRSSQVVIDSGGIIALAFKNTDFNYELLTCKVDGTSLTTTSALLPDGTQNTYDPALSITSYDSQFGFIARSSNGRGYVRSFYALDTTLTTENFIGISDGSYVNGVSATIQTKGSVDDAQSSLTIGKKYYVLPDGTLSTTASTNVPVFVGTAIASNKLIVKG